MLVQLATPTRAPAPIWTPVAHEDDIEARSARTVRYAGVRIALFRGASGKVYALEDRCPHKNGPLSEGIVHGERVTCPLHAWVLELRSGEATGADHGCARSYPVQVIDGVIYLSLPEVV